MDEREFRRLFQQAIGEAPTPPDLALTARRALDRPVRRGSLLLLEGLAAVAAVLVIAAIIGFNLLSHHRPTGPFPAPATTVAASPTVTATATATDTPAEACSDAHLSLANGGTQGAAGHRFLMLTLTNTGATPCTIDGFPSAQLRASDGTPVPTHVVDQGGQLSNTPPPAKFALPPAQKAGFQVSWGTVMVNDQPCANAGILDIGPPGQAPSPKLELTGLSIDICNSGELDASALQPSP